MPKATKRKPPSRRGKKVERKPGHLPPMKRRFVPEYLTCNDAGEAARRAGSKAKNPHKVGYNFLQDPAVIAALEEGRAKLAAKLELKAEQVLDEERCILSSDVRKLFHDDGSLKAPRELDPDTARSVASFKVFETTNKDGEKRTTYEYRFWDKGGSLKRVGEHLGMFVQKVEHSGTINQGGTVTVYIPDNGRGDGRD